MVPVGLAGLATIRPWTGGDTASSIAIVGLKSLSGPTPIRTTSMPSASRMFLYAGNAGSAR